MGIAGVIVWLPGVMNMLTKTYLVSPPFHEDNHSELLFGAATIMTLFWVP